MTTGFPGEDELRREREVEGVARVLVFVVPADDRQVEAQSGLAQRPNEVEVGQVELDLAVEGAHEGVEEGGVLAREARQVGEGLREDLRHLVENPSLDGVEIATGAVVLGHGIDRMLFEAGKGAGHLKAVVALVVVGPDGDPGAVQPHVVADAVKGGPEP